MSDTMPKSPAWSALAAWILAAYMRLVYYSARKQFVDSFHIQDLFDRGQPLILAAWHRHTIQSPFCYLAFAPKERRLWAIASASKDGGLAAQGLKNLGIDAVRGSSSRGGMAALRRMVKLIKSGQDLAFTPDGPRGPVFEVADGVLMAARLSGAPIVPISFAARRCKLLNSWDRLIVPFPFTRLRFTYGVPLYVSRDVDGAALDALRDQLRTEMMRISDLAANFR